MLHAAAGDPDGFSELRVLQLAEQLSSKRIADDAHLLATARLADDDWRRSAIDELHGLIVDALSHPALRRRGCRRPPRPAAPPRSRGSIRATNWRARGSKPRRRRSCSRTTRWSSPAKPGSSNRCRGTAMSESPSVPTPNRGVGASTSSCRDRAGVLARLTRALAGADLNVVAATLVTWPDGGVLDSFVVASSERPNPRDLAGRMERAVRGRQPTAAPIDVEVTFDDNAAPWHTVCVTHGPDRPGLLAAIASAFDEAKVDVHAARVAERARCRRRRQPVRDHRSLRPQARRRPQGGSPPRARRHGLTPARTRHKEEIVPRLSRNTASA